MPATVEAAAVAEESPADPSAPQVIQIRPCEVLVKPGQKVQFSTSGFDDGGRLLGRLKPQWSTSPADGAINGAGYFTAPGPGGSVGTVSARLGDLSATARVRIVPELPIFEDFESYGEGEMLSWWIGVSKAKHAIETSGGSKVLKKLADDRGPKFNRSRVYITPPLNTGYTVAADVMGTEQRRRRGDVGLINARYRLELFGNVRRLRVMSWVPGPRFEKSIEFPWDPDRWYRMKFRVDLDGGTAPTFDDELIYLVTSNGVDEGHKELPVPAAPSFIAVEKRSGKVVWERDDPGENILHGQWSSPACGVIGGTEQAVFPGGDGRLYSVEPKTGKLLWTFQCNPADSVWKLGGHGTRNNIIATPVIHDMLAAVWSSPYVVDGKVLLGDEDGKVVVFQVGREKRVLFEADMGSCVYTTPVAANGVLYITNREKLFAIEKGARGDMNEVN